MICLLAKDIMTKEVVTVHIQDTVESVIKLLIDKDISGVPVVDNENKLIGIVSEGDLIYKSKKFHFPLYFTILDSYIFLESTDMIKKQMLKMSAYSVGTMMTEDVVSASEDESVERLATLMSEKNVNRIPIVNGENQVVGIVTRKDIIKSYTQK